MRQQEVLVASAAAFCGVLWVVRKDVALWLRLRLWLLSKVKSVVLSRVKVAVSTLLDESLKDLADDEGFVLCDVTLEKGIITKVTASKSHGLLDCRKAVLFPCFADAHTHAIKANAVPRTRNPTGSMTGALLAESDDIATWWSTEGDVKRRMRFALECAYHHGTKYVRTHLDGSVSALPEVRANVWKSFDELRSEFEKKGLVLQGVANLFLTLWGDEERAEEHADEAKKHQGTVLGSYCGNVSQQPLEVTISCMDGLFAQAIRTSMDVDLHIDETNDPKANGLWALISSLKKAKINGFKGKVLLGHCTALSLRDDAQDIITSLAEFGDSVFVVANPFSNLRLQDRRGSAPPFSIAIPPELPRTPQWRGLTLVQELRAQNVPVACASDNVRDFWRPYGDYDLLAAFAEAIAIGHLDTAPTEGSWVDMVTCLPTKIFEQHQKGFIAKGQPADLIIFPRARRASELFSRPHNDRIVIRHGRPQFSALPDFIVLDDLVDKKTNRTNLPSNDNKDDTTAADLLRFK